MEQEELFREINSTISNIEAEMVKLKRLVQESQGSRVKGQGSGDKEVESPHIDGRLIADLHKAIGLNDRIRFQKELFGGNADLMNTTIDFLNAVSSYSEALKYLNENFSWKDDDETVVYFKEILKRKAYLS